MTIKVGRKIVLADGRQGIIKYIDPRKDVVNEYGTGESYPTMAYTYQNITVILQNGHQITTPVRTGTASVSYPSWYGTTGTANYLTYY